MPSGYPILNRASFGIFGAWWPTFNRAVMAIVWNGVNAVQGAQCVYVMLHALTPHIANIKNVMGEGSALDSGGMIGFVVFWLLTCCFLVIPVPKVCCSLNSGSKMLTLETDAWSGVC